MHEDEAVSLNVTCTCILNSSTSTGVVKETQRWCWLLLAKLTRLQAWDEVEQHYKLPAGGGQPPLVIIPLCGWRAKQNQTSCMNGERCSKEIYACRIQTPMTLWLRLKKASYTAGRFYMALCWAWLFAKVKAVYGVISSTPLTRWYWCKSSYIASMRFKDSDVAERVNAPDC